MKKTCIRTLCGALLLALLLGAFPMTARAQERTKTEALHTLFTTADLMDATVGELLAAMEDGRLTSVRLTQMYLDRIEAYDDALELNSILALNPHALEEAAAADAAREAGEPLGKLQGIPVVVKDNIDVEGMATTAGSLTRTYAIAYDDTAVVARLRAEGAVILGKTNMAEFAQYGHNSRSGVGGITHNAYDLSRTPAGSSGGTAVAVTCNFAAVGLGTDTGSSIRRPSSFANLYGLRPSYGLVSRDGLLYLNYNKDVIGPMCRTPEDLALLMDVLAGSDENDLRSVDADQYLPDGGYCSVLNADGLRGKRIGYLANSFGYYYGYGDQALQHPTPLDDKIVGMTERFREAMVSGGAVLVDLFEYLPESAIASYSYAETWEGQQRFRAAVTDLLAEQQIDAVVFISQMDVPQVEIYADDSKNNPACYMNEFGPLAGLPEIVLPMGFAETDPDNGVDYPLPLGANLFAGYGQDAVLVEIAYAYAQQTSVREQPWTTPALPDASLAAFARTLLTEAEALQLSVYTAESAEALRQAKQQLQGLCMEGTDASGTAVSVAAYQAAVAELALAYDALAPWIAPSAPPLSAVLPLFETPEADPPVERTAEEPEKSGVPLVLVILGATAGTAGVAAAVFLRRRKKTRSIP